MTKEVKMNHRTARINGPRNRGMESVQDCLGLMEHLSSCNSVRCTVRGCLRIKKAIQHAKECKRKGQCSLCKQVIRICVLHAKSCLVTNCRVYFCGMVRMRLSIRQGENGSHQGTSGARPGFIINKGQERQSLSVTTVGHGVDGVQSPLNDSNKEHQYNVAPVQRSFSAFKVKSTNSTSKIMDVQRSLSYDERNMLAPEIIGSGLLQTIGTRAGTTANSTNDFTSAYEKMDISNC